MAEVKDELLDHDYDGIKEYDNPLPPWWVNLFYITIVWGVLYFLYYHVTEWGDRSVDEYKKEFDPKWSKSKDPDYVAPKYFEPYYRVPYYSLRTDVTQKMIAEKAGKPEAPKEEEIIKDFTALTDAGSINKGKDLYIKTCVACHGMLGEGGIGPNLTDDYWIHGSGINNVMRTVIKGVPEKGMIARGKTFPEEDLLRVSRYVLTLRGTNPPNPKAPQGTLVK